MAFFKRNAAPAPTPAPAPAPAPELTGEARKQMHLERIVEYANSMDLKFHTENNHITFKMGINSKLENCTVMMIARKTGIVSLAVCPIKAKPENYASVVEFITRANYGTVNGNFEFDYGDGEIRYKSFLLSTEGMPSLSEVHATALLPIQMLDKYGDGLLKNLMGFGEPEKDIAEIED